MLYLTQGSIDSFLKSVSQFTSTSEVILLYFLDEFVENENLIFHSIKERAICINILFNHFHNLFYTHLRPTKYSLFSSGM